MRRLTFLLRPSWVILALLVVAFAYLCFSVLAPWQLGKNGRTSHRNHLISESVKADPVPVQQLLGPGLGGAPEHDEWRRVSVTGRYLPDATVLVRLRSDSDNPAFEVLTGFRLADDRTILIDRGYVHPVGPDATVPPSVSATAAPRGAVRVLARIRRNEGVMPGKAPIVENGYRQVYSIDSGQIGGLIRIPVVDGYLQTEADQPGAFRPIPLPQLDAGPYLSYGLQWLCFGVMAPLGLAYFVRAELRERRKEQVPVAAEPEPTPDPMSESESESESEPEPKSEPESEPEPVPAEPPPVSRFRRTRPTPEPVVALTATEAKLADRYGRRL